MPPVYSTTCINARLQGVVSTIDGGGGAGKLILLAGGTPVSTITLQTPSGSASGGVLTFNTPLTDSAAAGTGTVTTAVIEDFSGNIVVSGLTVGIPLSGADITISNGLNNTLIQTGQAVQLLTAQITGS